MFMGDFNARVGTTSCATEQSAIYTTRLPIDTTTNLRGKKLAHFLTSHGFLLHNGYLRSE